MPSIGCCDLGRCLKSLMVTSLLAVGLCGFSQASMHFQPGQNTVSAFIISQIDSEGCLLPIEERQGVSRPHSQKWSGAWL